MKLIDFEVDGLIDALNSHMCTYQISRDFLKKNVIEMKHQENIQFVNWKETKNFSANSYFQVFGDKLLNIEDYKAKVRKSKLGWFDREKRNQVKPKQDDPEDEKLFANDLNLNIHYETYAITDLVDPDIMQKVQDSSLKNRFMFDCKPVERLFRYKWSMIEDNNYFNFKLYVTMVLCLAVNTFMLNE